MRRWPAAYKRAVLALLAVLGLHALALWGLGFGWGLGWRDAQWRAQLAKVAVFDLVPATPGMTRSEPAAHLVPASTGAAPSVRAMQQDPAPDVRNTAPTSNAARPELQIAAPMVLQAGLLPLPSSVALRFALAEMSGLVVRHGETWMSWSEKDGRYTAGLKSALAGQQTMQTSTGQVNAGIVPTAFSEQEQPASPVSEAAQDPVSVLWFLGQILGSQEQLDDSRLSAGGELSLHVGGIVHPLRWRIEQIDDLMLPAGSYRAIQIRSESAAPGWHRVDIWYAPALRFLPVRIKRTAADGRVFDAILQEAAV